MLTGELYYNYLRGDQQPQIAAAFTEGAFLRLREVKRRYDPENIFRLNLNLEPAAEQSARALQMAKVGPS